MAPEIIWASRVRPPLLLVRGKRIHEQDLEAGFGRELVWHAGVKTTMIHTNALKKGGGGVRSPLDR